VEIQLNTLYVVTRGATINRDHLTVRVQVERQTRLVVPVHQLEAVAVFGGVHVTPGAMALCAERGVAVTFLTESGRLLCRVDAPSSGNVLVRREQYRRADLPERRAEVARGLVAGKIHNARNSLLRAARETDRAEDQASLSAAAARLGDGLPALGRAGDVDSIRGHEGDAARVYFDVFSAMVRQNRDAFRLNGRTRRPPLDRMNALLSFLYTLFCAATAWPPPRGSGSTRRSASCTPCGPAGRRWGWT
jgi:CRISPR-associated protein Cas1